MITSFVFTDKSDLEGVVKFVIVVGIAAGGAIAAIALVFGGMKLLETKS